MISFKLTLPTFDFRNKNWLQIFYPTSYSLVGGGGGMAVGGKKEGEGREIKKGVGGKEKTAPKRG